MSATHDASARAIKADSGVTYSSNLILWIPAIGVLLYPWILKAFNWAFSAPANGATASRSMLLACIFLAAAFAVPLVSLILASTNPKSEPMRASDIRARRYALVVIGAPSAYVFLGVFLNMFKIPIADVWIWTPIWFCLALFTARSTDAVLPVHRGSTAVLRVAHGVCGAITTLFVLFHLMNHVTGLWGGDIHEAVADIGRTVYRAFYIEPVLVLAMFFQVITGIRLAWTWSERAEDKYRMFQVASGACIAMFALCHMNSVFIMARTILGIHTDYVFATGGGKMIPDPWAIRLFPHYALGGFFVLAHLCCGLRVVALAHGLNRALANKLWWVGAVGSAVVSLTIMLGLIGVRVV
nr:hypothetical protein [uncultured Pseudomonas sp.]